MPRVHQTHHHHEHSQTSATALAWGIALGLVLAVSIWGLAIAGQLGRAHPNNQWVMEAWAHKQAHATTLNSSRLLVTGGSSAMFGVNSSMLEDTYSVPAVNLGVNAGLGLPIILNQMLSIARPGDLVIITLEYPLFNHNGDINHVMNDFYLSRPKELLLAWSLYREAMPWHRWLPLMAYEIFQIIMQTSPARLVQGYRGLPEGFFVSGTYGAHHLDLRGDQTHTSRSQRQPWMTQQVVAASPHHYGAEHDEEAPGWALLRHAQDQLRAQGSCLVLVPPALLFHSTYRDDPVESEFYARLPETASRHGLSYLGEPKAFMYSVDDMFDTDYHLTDEARQAHTRRLIDVLGAPDSGFDALIERTCQPIEARIPWEPMNHETTAPEAPQKKPQARRFDL